MKGKEKKYAYIEARKVLNTCINIGYDIYAKNPFASFGFIGMPTVDGKEIEKLKETKRYKVYEKLAKFHFKPENFEHRRNKEKSLYLLLNKKKIQQNGKTYDEIKKMFLKIYDIDDMYANLLVADGE
jgi:hypothetical protein